MVLHGNNMVEFAGRPVVGFRRGFDYYFCKKLAHYYIKRSQQPICLMFDEPEDGHITLYAVNDTVTDTEINYTITEMYKDEEIISGTVCARTALSLAVCNVEVEENEQKFYLIEWQCGSGKYKNHFCTGLLNIDYKKYLSAMKKCGFDEFEGFI